MWPSSSSWYAAALLEGWWQCCCVLHCRAFQDCCVSRPIYYLFSVNCCCVVLHNKVLGMLLWYISSTYTIDTIPRKKTSILHFFFFFENRIYVFILHFTLLLELQVFTPIRGGHNVFKRIQFIYLQVSYCLKKYYYVSHYYNKYMQYHISVFYIYICNKKILISAKVMQSSFMYYLNKISLLYIQPMRCCQVIFALQICAVAKVTICQLARISL